LPQFELTFTAEGTDNHPTSLSLRGLDYSTYYRRNGVRRDRGNSGEILQEGLMGELGGRVAGLPLLPNEQHCSQMHCLTCCWPACLTPFNCVQVINCGHASTRQYLLQVLHFWAAVSSLLRAPCGCNVRLCRAGVL
jgi:hypothetical protein